MEQNEPLLKKDVKCCATCTRSKKCVQKYNQAHDFVQKYNHGLIEDTKGVSYPLFTIILTLIIGTCCWIMLIPAINIVSVAMNGCIADGTLSVQTVAAYNFNLNLFKILPLFMVLGLFLYAITQALLRKGTEG